MNLGSDRADEEIIARYRDRYGRQDQIFWLFDRLLGTLMLRPTTKLAALETPPRRILLVDPGYLGDVIISSGLLPVLHHAFPRVEVGFLTGTYSRAVVDGHPLIARTHFVDHWYLSRRPVSRWRRFAEYLAKMPRVIREIRATKYDVAVIVRSWFPNLIPLVWMAKIPVRVAYDRLGFGPLLTHRLSYVYERRHEFDYQLDLLRVLGVSDGSLAMAWPTLAPPSEDALQQAKCVLGDVSRYRILHPAASIPTRDWSVECWQTLARDLLMSGITPVITGSGPRDKAVAHSICVVARGSLDAVNAVSWAGLVALISNAEAVYAVNTSVGHVASAMHRPIISIQGGMAEPMHWAPLGAAVVTKRTTCHPCLKKNGCSTRECILGITVQQVQAAAKTCIVGPAIGPLS